MEGKYAVFMGKEEAGTVQVIRQGLYYRIICKCRISSDSVCRLGVSCGGVQTHIGVPVPEGQGFALDKKIPVKKFGQGMPEFFLAAQHEQSRGKFIPICPEEPFGYIERLKDSFLAEQDGQKGIIIKEER